jgi:hypothetical protein
MRSRPWRGVLVSLATACWRAALPRYLFWWPLIPRGRGVVGIRHRVARQILLRGLAHARTPDHR